jgi:hypothetical protein
MNEWELTAVELVGEKVRHKTECLECVYRNKNNVCFASQHAECLLTKAILQDLSAAGCRQLDPDQTLSVNPYAEVPVAGLPLIPQYKQTIIRAWFEGQQSMADRVKVLPLMEEK